MRYIIHESNRYTELYTDASYRILFCQFGHIVCLSNFYMKTINYEEIYEHHLNYLKENYQLMIYISKKLSFRYG